MPSEFLLASSHRLICTSWLETTLKTLLHASRAPGVSNVQRIAACNVLCGLVDLCIESDASTAESIILSQYWCTALLDLCLEQHDNARVKSSKQILTTLSRLYTKACVAHDSSSLRDAGICRTFEVLFRGSEHAKAKPALLALILLLSKRVVTSLEITSLHSAWVSRQAPPEASASDESHADRFMDGLFRWVTFTDVAPIAGRLISVLFNESRSASLAATTKDTEESSFKPWWTDILIHNLRQYTEHLEMFRIYVFPGLFQTNYDTYLAFLRCLGLDELEQSDATNSSTDEAEFRKLLLLSALQTGKEIGFVEERGMLKAWPGVSLS